MAPGLRGIPIYQDCTLGQSVRGMPGHLFYPAGDNKETPAIVAYA